MNKSCQVDILSIIAYSIGITLTVAHNNQDKIKINPLIIILKMIPILIKTKDKNNMKKISWSICIIRIWGELLAKKAEKNSEIINRTDW